MTQSNNTQNTQSDIKYFNAHTEGMGYLSNLDSSKTTDGTDQMRLTFCMLEGDPRKTEGIYIHVLVKCAKSKALFEKIEGDINGGVKVFAGCRLANFRAKPFMYPEGHAKAGKLDVAYSARLIKLMYLKVGDVVVSLRENDETAQPTTDFGISVPAAQPVINEKPLFAQPPVVRLSKEDPNFEYTKARLQQAGYKWANEAKWWVMPKIQLNPQDPRLKIKGKQLEDWGYACVNFDEVNWEFTLPRSAPSQAKSSGQSQNKGYRKYNQNTDKAPL